MQVGAPFRAIRYVINDSAEGDQLAGAAFACGAAQFHLCDDVVGDVHWRDYTGIGTQKNLLKTQEIFLVWIFYFIWMLFMELSNSPIWTGERISPSAAAVVLPQLRANLVFVPVRVYLTSHCQRPCVERDKVN